MAALLLLVGGFFVAASHYGTLDALQTRGVESMGTVVRKYGTTGRSGSLDLFFEFKVDGRTFEGKKQVSLQEYDDAVVGTPIPITYLPNDPKVFHIGAVTQDAFNTFWLLVLVAGSVALLVFAGALALLEWDVRRQLRIARDWPAVSAEIVSVVPKDDNEFNVRFQYMWNGKTIKTSLKVGDYERKGRHLQSIKFVNLLLNPQKPRNIFLPAHLRYAELADVPSNSGDDILRT